jgi:ABC-2 type transport system permease protein
MEVAVSKAVPGIGSVLATLTGVTLRRLMRSRAVWVVGVIALLPVLMSAIFKGRFQLIEVTSRLEVIVMALLPAVFVASSVGEEIEDRTATYLWSRPLPRWAIIVGKLIALAPIASLLIVAGWVLAMNVAGVAVAPRSTLAFAAGGLAISMVAAGIALLVPKHGMSLSIIYLVIIDMLIGVIPASLQQISITHQVWLLTGNGDESAITAPAITMAIIAGVWLTIGLLRLRRLEA